MSDLLPQSVVTLLWQIPFAVLVAYLYFRIDKTWRESYREEMERWREFHNEESKRWEELIRQQNDCLNKLVEDTGEIVRANTVALQINGVLEELKNELAQRLEGQTKTGG